MSRSSTLLYIVGDMPTMGSFCNHDHSLYID